MTVEMKNWIKWLPLLLIFVSASAQENLITNPGFEAESKGKPSDWWLYEGQGTTELKWDDTVAHSGKASGRLQAAAAAKSTLVSPKFAVAPGDELRISVWVRGKGFSDGQNATYTGLAFRRADGAVFGRAYFRASLVAEKWVLVSGEATAPTDAVSAEMHLGYTNAPGALWFDDAAAAIISPVSLSLIEGAKPWPGEQEILLLVANRMTNDFRGNISASLGKETKAVPVTLRAKETQRVKIPLNFRGVGPHEYRFSLEDGEGKALRTLQGKFQTKAALVLEPACPYYHLIGEGNGETRVDARINLSPEARTDCKLQLSVSDAQGKEIQSLAVDASRGEFVGGTLTVPNDKEGAFTLQAKLIDASGKQIAEAKGHVHVIAEMVDKISIGPDGFLRIGGNPHFPLGMYSCGQYPDMAKAGFNATHNYGITTGEPDEPINPNDSQVKELLDRSWTNGMRMMVELPRKAIVKAQWAQVRRRIETFRHHPGLLCWGSEERVARGETPVATIEKLYSIVHELDPDHPLVLGDTKAAITKFRDDRSDFFPDQAMDIGVWWWYPIPLHEPDADGLEGGAKNAGLLTPPSWLTTTKSKKPLWIAIQSYQKPTKDARFPTPAEYRAQAYLSIINGVKGLFFYTGSGQKDYEGKPSGLLNKPIEGHWDYVKKLVAELHEFSPVIMAPASKGKVVMSPATAPVEFATRELDGKSYLIAASKSPKPQKVKFTGDLLKGSKAKLLFEERAVSLERESFESDFEPFGVHVYQIEK